MRIDRLTVENFRCFKHQEFEFLPQFNLLAGDNGSGKTAVLEAIAISTGDFLQEMGINPKHTRNWLFKDSRLAQFNFAREVTLERQLPIKIQCSGEIDGRQCSWERKTNKSGGRHYEDRRNPIRKVAQELIAQVLVGLPIVLPVLTFYGTGRLWAQRKDSETDVPVQTGMYPPASRLAGYESAFDSTADNKTLFEWVKTQKLISLDEKQISAGFECVKGAVATCLQSHGWDELDYRVRDDSLIVLKHAEENSVDSGPTQLPFDYLSDGYRNTIAMVADIARRAFILNPQFGAEAALKTPGIVLIDELDLHLHPKWQRTIVKDLKSAFPLVQFFATSHSPFIIQSLEPGELLDLDPDENFPYPDDEYVDRSIEDIAKYVMGTPGPQSRRTEEKEKVAMEYYRLLDEGRDASSGEVERLKRRLDELEAPFSDDVAFSTFLKFQRETAHLGNGE